MVDEKYEAIWKARREELTGRIEAAEQRIAMYQQRTARYQEETLAIQNQMDFDARVKAKTAAVMRLIEAHDQRVERAREEELERSTTSQHPQPVPEGPL